MNMFASAFDRSRLGASRKEDELQIYYAHTGYTKYTVLTAEKYKNYPYNIETDGRCPELVILSPEGLSVFAGKREIILPDRDGKQTKMERVYRILKHRYDSPGDYVDEKQDGKKYTVDELKQDAKAFIDYLVNSESKFIDDCMD